MLECLDQRATLGFLEQLAVLELEVSVVAETADRTAYDALINHYLYDNTLP